MHFKVARAIAVYGFIFNAAQLAVLIEHLVFVCKEAVVRIGL